MTSSSTSRDLLRAVLVAVLAVAQVASAALTPVLSRGPDTGAISDANNSPVTPAGYAFAIWGLIYLACLAYASYQLLPTQRGAEVQRRTGWWLSGAFFSSAIWIPLFNSGLLGLAQLVIVGLVVCLAAAAVALTHAGPARSRTEQFGLRLPVTLYLGWATIASLAGFATTFRSWGMPAESGWVTGLSLLLVVIGTAASLAAVTRLTGVAGYAFASAWALVAVAVGTYVLAVRWAALAGVVVVLGGLVLRAARNRRAAVVLLG